VIHASWTPWTKYFVILTVTMGACFVLYEGCVRRFAPLRFAFGMKAQRIAVAPEHTAIWRKVVRDDVQ
jgi:glucan biosynthesis protein C